jgi:hypothetical protein
VQWTAPADNRSPITHYTVTTSPGGETATVTGTQATITGLAAATYRFKVRATNAVGDGPWSSASNAVTVAKVVAASAAVAAVAWFVWHPLDSALGRSFPGQVVSLGLALAASVGVYLGACRLLRVRELQVLLSLRSRLRRA